jgi:hypothetical protein
VVAAAHRRRFIVWLVLAFLLLTAFSPAAGALFLAILVPVWYFFGNTVTLLSVFRGDEDPAPLFPYYPAISSRPPPYQY